MLKLPFCKTFFFVRICKEKRRRRRRRKKERKGRKEGNKHSFTLQSCFRKIADASKSVLSVLHEYMFIIYRENLVFFFFLLQKEKFTRTFTKESLERTDGYFSIQKAKDPRSKFYRFLLLLPPPPNYDNNSQQTNS